MTAQLSDDLYRAGSGEPLLLIHGFTDTWRAWKPIVGELVPFFDVIAPTLNGHQGGPPMPDGQMRSFAHMGDLLERRLDELGLDTVHVAGNSLGGGLSLELAKRGRARSVVGLSPAGGLSPDNRAEALRIAKFFAKAQRRAHASRRAIPRAMRSPSVRKRALIDVMQHGDQMPAREAARMALASIDCTVVPNVLSVLREGEPWLTGLEQIDVPVLIAWGAKDRVLPVKHHTARLRDEIPGVDFRLLPGIGHVPMWDDPHLIASLVREFILSGGEQIVEIPEGPPVDPNLELAPVAGGGIGEGRPIGG